MKKNLRFSTEGSFHDHLCLHIWMWYAVVIVRPCLFKSIIVAFPVFKESAVKDTGRMGRCLGNSILIDPGYCFSFLDHNFCRRMLVVLYDDCVFFPSGPFPSWSAVLQEHNTRGINRKMSSLPLSSSSAFLQKRIFLPGASQ